MTTSARGKMRRECEEATTSRHTRSAIYGFVFNPLPPQTPFPSKRPPHQGTHAQQNLGSFSTPYPHKPPFPEEATTSRQTRVRFTLCQCSPTTPKKVTPSRHTRLTIYAFVSPSTNPHPPALSHLPRAAYPPIRRIWLHTGEKNVLAPDYVPSGIHSSLMSLELERCTVLAPQYMLISLHRPLSSSFYWHWNSCSVKSEFLQSCLFVVCKTGLALSYLSSDLIIVTIAMA